MDVVELLSENSIIVIIVVATILITGKHFLWSILKSSMDTFLHLPEHVKDFHKEISDLRKDLKEESNKIAAVDKTEEKHHDQLRSTLSDMNAIMQKIGSTLSELQLTIQFQNDKYEELNKKVEEREGQVRRKLEEHVSNCPNRILIEKLESTVTEVKSDIKEIKGSKRSGLFS